MFRYMATAVVDKDAKGFDSTYKEALSYMNFISKDKVHRHGGEVSQSFRFEIPMRILANSRILRCTAFCE